MAVGDCSNVVDTDAVCVMSCFKANCDGGKQRGIESMSVCSRSPVSVSAKRTRGLSFLTDFDDVIVVRFTTILTGLVFILFKGNSIAMW